MPSAATGSTGCAPAPARPYLRLSRADRPIGTWLLLIPCWWGLLLAAAADPGGPAALRPLDRRRLRASARSLMRGAGCTWNDLTDRDIDARVARTRSRPLPSGQVTPRQAAAWMVAQALAACAILLTFPPQAVALGIGLAGAGRDLSLRQALHLVAAGLPRARLQLGRAARLGGARPRARRGAAAALCRGHRLDAVLRHDLRPPGPRGRRADRRALDGAAVRDARPSRGSRASSSAATGARGLAVPRRRPAGPALLAALAGVARLRGASRLAAPPASTSTTRRSA